MGNIFKLLKFRIYLFIYFFWGGMLEIPDIFFFLGGGGGERSMLCPSLHMEKKMRVTSPP